MNSQRFHVQLRVKIFKFDHIKGHCKYVCNKNKYFSSIKEICSDLIWMKTQPDASDSFLLILKYRYSIICACCMLFETPCERFDFWCLRGLRGREVSSIFTLVSEWGTPQTLRRDQGWTSRMKFQKFIFIAIEEYNQLDIDTIPIILYFYVFWFLICSQCCIVCIFEAEKIKQKMKSAYWTC